MGLFSVNLINNAAGGEMATKRNSFFRRYLKSSSVKAQLRRRLELISWETQVDMCVCSTSSSGVGCQTQFERRAMKKNPPDSSSFRSGSRPSHTFVGFLFLSLSSQFVIYIRLFF